MPGAQARGSLVGFSDEALPGIRLRMSQLVRQAIAFGPLGFEQRLWVDACNSEGSKLNCTSFA